MSLQWMICFGDGGFEKLTVQEVLPIEERETRGTKVPLGGLMLIVFGCIIYAIVQQMWSSAFILIAMEACIIMVTFGAGLLEGLLQIAQESLGIFMRS